MMASEPKPRGRPKMGRPTKLTKQVSDDIIKLLRVGNYFETACAGAGIIASIGRDWLRKGAHQKRGLYKDFHAAVKEAEAFAEASALTRIRQFGGKQWQAEAWFLERRMPAKWGRWERKDDAIDSQARKLTLSESNMDQPGDEE